MIGSVHAPGGSAAFATAVFAAHGAFTLALLVGYHTPGSCAVTSVKPATVPGPGSP